MNWRWEECGGWWMCTASPHFVRGRRYVGCLAIQRSASYGLSGGGKNFVRSLWSALVPNLRSQAAPGARSLGWRHQDLFGDREPSGALPELRQGEPGEAGVALQQPLLHQAVCVLRGPALPELDDPGRRPRVALGLEHRKGTRPAVHAGAAAKSRDAGATDDRHRRSLDPQGAHLPHRGQRPAAAPANLVRRTGPLRSQRRPLLPVAGSRKKHACAAGGNGHVETLSQRHPQPRRRRPASCSTSST
jgi:hypothetical protein